MSTWAEHASMCLPTWVLTASSMEMDVLSAQVYIVEVGMSTCKTILEGTEHGLSGRQEPT